MRYLKGTYKPTKTLTAGKIIGRILLSVFTAVVLLIIALYLSLYVVLNGECEPLRERLVLSATQASATKWLPSLFIPQEEVDGIVAKSLEVTTDTLSLEEYLASQVTEETAEAEDKWSKAIDGMLYEKVTGPTFTGYVLLIRDPSRVYVGVSTDNFASSVAGIRIFDMAKKDDAIAVVNAGEFEDQGGQGTGARPMGLTYSNGKCVWDDGLKRTFIGFDSDNRLVVTEPMTKETADKLSIRDAVSFQNGNTLITSSDGEVVFHYSDWNTGTAQRTAIGQCADGTVIFLVTDGRTASSLGATKNDVIDIMVKYGAVTAGMLDGGSSSLMYYEDYYTKYGIDTENLDKYQQMGLVNSYKAFTNPRRLPTFFCISREAE
ncbi:MAG: phosphodiester glycosidase family protein [Clostridia bacterium]|nr:phosphodiester glycosidase family protein [Clostridia bacterium]